MKTDSKIGRFEKLTSATSRAFNWVACGAILAMLLLGTVDLVGLKVFRWPFAGAFEVIGLLGLILVTFAISYTQVRKGHIVVDFVANLLPKRFQMVLDTIIPLLALVLFALITWQMYNHGLRLQASGAVSATERIPLAPLAYAAAVCFLMMCLVLIADFVNMVRVWFSKKLGT